MKKNKYKIYLFGSKSLVGKYIINYLSSIKNVDEIIILSRKKTKGANFINLDNPQHPENYKFEGNGIVINLAPIWSFTNYLNYLQSHDVNNLKKIKNIITCSSTSVLTKKYSNNIKDKCLVSKLENAENFLVYLSNKFNIPYTIIRPTLIYGQYKQDKDKNLSKIELALKFLPFIVLPENSGLRQPIHATQVANVIVRLLKIDKYKNKIINIGGDEIISYEEMIKRIRDKKLRNKISSRCIIFTIPSNYFYFMANILFLINPNFNAAIYRLCSDFAGFNKAHEIIKTKPLSFPVNDQK